MELLKNITQCSEEKIIEFTKIITGDGDGSGYGYGYGSGIKKINNCIISKIDNVNTIITNIKGNIAKGFIFNNDLTIIPTFIVKRNNYFSHGNTLEQSLLDLEEKIFSNLNIEERLEEFKNKFLKDKKYKGTEFFKWHNLLTGSCLQGRESFVKNKGIDLEEEFSVNEFLLMIKNDFGWNSIQQLEVYYAVNK